MPEVRLHGQKVIPGFLAHTRDPAEERREQRTLIVSGFSIPAPWCDRVSELQEPTTLNAHF